MILAVLVFTGFSLSAQDKTHTVARGQTLYSISKVYGISVDELIKANKLNDPSHIKQGQNLVIPSGSAKNGSKSTSQSAGKTVAQSGTAQTFEDYKVKSGDTLYSIARANATNVGVLRSANGLKTGSILKVGQIVKVPSSKKPDTEVATISADTSGNTAGSVDTQPGTPIPGTSMELEKITGTQNTTWPVKGEVFAIAGKFPGVAIKANKGDAVTSVSEGRVIYTGMHQSLGNIVFVQGDNGYVYVYGGNDSVAVQNGSVVKKGDAVGTVGQAPGLDVTQAYFSVWKDGTYMDPVKAPR